MFSFAESLLFDSMWWKDKIGTKASAMASKSECYLEDFGIKLLRDSRFVCAKMCLVIVISLKSNCKTFNNLVYQMFKTKEKTLNELPPTSSTIHGHLLQSHYFVYLSSHILNGCRKMFEPAKYEWIIENGLLVPTKNFAVTSDLTTKWQEGLEKGL